jgi:hypothetical protein
MDQSLRNPLMTAFPPPFSPENLTPDNCTFIARTLQSLPEGEVADWMEAHQDWFSRMCHPAWFEAAAARGDDRVIEHLLTHPVTAPALLFWIHHHLGKRGENEAGVLCRFGIRFPDLMTLPVTSANCKRPLSLIERLSSNGDWRTVAAIEKAGISLAGPASPDPIWQLSRKIVEALAETPDHNDPDLMEATSWLAGLAKRQPVLFSPHRPVSVSEDSRFVLEHKVKNLLLDKRTPGAFHALAWAIEHLGWSLDDPLEIVFGESVHPKGTWRDEWARSWNPEEARLVVELEALLLDRQLQTGRTSSSPRMRL